MKRFSSECAQAIARPDNVTLNIYAASVFCVIRFSKGDIKVELEGLGVGTSLLLAKVLEHVQKSGVAWKPGPVPGYSGRRLLNRTVWGSSG